MSWIWGNDVTVEQANMVVMSLQGELDERQATIEALVKALQKEKKDYRDALVEEVHELRERKEALQKELDQIDVLIAMKTEQINSGEKVKAKKAVAAPAPTPAPAESTSSTESAPAEEKKEKKKKKSRKSEESQTQEPDPEAALISLPSNSELVKVRGVDANTAFIIQRSNNANTVVYKGNILSNNTLDSNSPLHVYWIMYALPGPPFPTEELNVIERNTAYGATATARPGTSNEYDVVLASLKDRSIVLFVDDRHNVRARTTINGRANVYLERVYVQSTTSWGLPKVEFIEIFGVDPATHEEVYEKKIP
ncbi:hypothetical protein AC1031_016200 [Aphanomyces cochlioides]|nr:hypothetical protein AC1031_016200 [Aphanomyces cochlioides]